MEKRLIEKNGDYISPLGFGAMRLPIDKEYEKSIELLREGIDKGINYIDTAFFYGFGKNEKFIGEALKNGYRNKVKIATKIPAFSIKKREEMDEYLNKELELLNTDYIDYYYLHSIDLKVLKRLKKKGIFKFLDKAKKDGKIKNACFSYHGKADELREIIDTYDWDGILIQFNYFDENIQVKYEDIQYAHSKGLGIFIMEPLKGGLLSKLPKEAEEIFKKENSDLSPADWAFSWLYNIPEITCVLSGMKNKEEIEENIKIAETVKPNSLSNKELETIKKVKNIMQEKLPINCSSCGYCMPCKYGVDIPKAFQMVNEEHLFNEKHIENQIKYILTLGGVYNEPSNAGLCTQCNKCIPLCTQGLNIPKELEKVKKEYEKPGYNQLLWLIKHIAYPIFNKYIEYKR
ncbi:aldo/keto reductase [Methanobrevibacter sp. 87.7]|uniref:aldo/keto reductase n=1 Tax=Methanobrevibacter sp. 87.7 TaxID=387957 RepID=UPI000B50FEBD|nr:aldo/keto reductase [Methanobrevibacter sp. 87.7]OWT33171.1 aldo/keto reductase [Methanobrevibacter sp. 87.7]